MVITEKLSKSMLKFGILISRTSNPHNFNTCEASVIVGNGAESKTASKQSNKS